MFLPSGILLSCSYDKKVIAWIYQKGEKFETIIKAEELRCMDYVADDGKLLLGTNKAAILTHKIVDLLNYRDTHFEMLMEQRAMEMDGDYGDYGDEDDLQRGGDDKDPFDDYDPMEGESVEDYIAKLHREN